MRTIGDAIMCLRRPVYRLPPQSTTATCIERTALCISSMLDFAIVITSVLHLIYFALTICVPNRLCLPVTIPSGISSVPSIRIKLLRQINCMVSIECGVVVVAERHLHLTTFVVSESARFGPKSPPCGLLRSKAASPYRRLKTMKRNTFTSAANWNIDTQLKSRIFSSIHRPPGSTKHLKPNL